MRSKVKIFVVHVLMLLVVGTGMFVFAPTVKASDQTTMVTSINTIGVAVPVAGESASVYERKVDYFSVTTTSPALLDQWYSSKNYLYVYDAEGERYTGNFVAGEVYKVKFNVYIATGGTLYDYKLADDVVVNVPGADDVTILEKKTRSVIVMVTFTAVESNATKISEVNITGLSTKAGDTMPYNNVYNIIPFATDNANVRVSGCYIEWVGSVQRITKIEDNKVYKVNLKIQANENYVFDENVAIKINGVAAELNAFDFRVGNYVTATAILRVGDPAPYAVVFNAKNPAGEKGGLYGSGEIRLPDCTYAAPSGKEFDAWIVQGDAYGIKYYPNDTYVVRSETVFDACWKLTNVPGKYTVIFENNGGSGSMSALYVDEGSSYTLPDCTYTAPRGSAFKAWSVNGTEYAVGATVTLTDHAVVMPIWEHTVLAGTATLRDGDYLANGSSSPTKEKPADGGYLYYKNNVLTMHNFVYEGAGVKVLDGTRSAIISSYAPDFTIVLEGANVLKQTDGRGTCIDLYYTPKVTFKGEGSLSLLGCFYGIYGTRNAVVEGGTFTSDISLSVSIFYGFSVLTFNGGTVNAKSSIYSSDVFINQGDITIDTDEYGIYANVTMNGGKLSINSIGNGFHAKEKDKQIIINGGEIIITATNSAFATNPKLAEGLSIQAATEINGVLGDFDPEKASSYRRVLIGHVHSKNLTSVPETPAQCTQNGVKEYFTCSCGAYFEDGDATKVISDLGAWKIGAGKIAADHKFGDLIPKVDSKHTESELAAGKDAHYFCGACETYFTSEKAAIDEADLIIPAPTHTAAEDDGDCTTDILCTGCTKVMTKGAESHVGGTATCKELAKCETCGKEYGALAGHTPNADDGDCMTAITCSLCGEVTTAGAEKHVGGTATCTAKAKCEVCDKEYGELAAHTYVDGTCACGATDPDYTPENDAPDAGSTDEPKADEGGIGAGAIIGIVVGAVAVLGGGGFALYWFVIKKKRI